jgi:hypothetical protein
MNGLTRRWMLGLGIMSGSPPFAQLAADAVAEDKPVIVADEKAVLFKIKDVTLERVNHKARTIDVRSGRKDSSLIVRNLPLSDAISIRVSFVFPGAANNLPFDWHRLIGLVGSRVSMMLRAESGALSVDSIATAND